MAMKVGSSRILVLSAENMEFTGQSGEKVTGCNIWYVAPDDNKDPKRKGSQPVAVRLEASEFPQITACPAFFDADLYMETEQVTKFGQRQTVTTVKPRNLQYVGALSPAPAGAPTPKVPTGS